MIQLLSLELNERNFHCVRLYVEKGALPNFGRPWDYLEERGLKVGQSLL